MAIPEEASVADVSVPFRMVAHISLGSPPALLMLNQTLSIFGNFFGFDSDISK